MKNLHCINAWNRGSQEYTGSLLVLD